MEFPKLELVEIGLLKSNSNNARKHSARQIRQLAKSMSAFQYVGALGITRDFVVMIGNGRLEAAKLLKLERLPCFKLDHLNDEQIRALALADNRIALDGEWDLPVLGAELKELTAIDLDFEIEATGFSIAEIDSLIEGLAVEEPGDPRDDVVPEKAPRRCNQGDLFQLGRHRLICGDARDPKLVARLMGGESARMGFIDPPYNQPVRSIGGLGKIKHPEFMMASGELNEQEFETFLREGFQNTADVCVDGAIVFVCMDWRHLQPLLSASRPVFREVKNLIVWVKDNGGMGTFYRSRHELIFAFKVGDAPHLNTFELGQHGRYRTNVWNYRGVNTFKVGRAEELSAHPTSKPVQLVADAIKDVSGRGDIVIDLYAGAGSTLIAAEKTGRRAFLCEIDPKYCDRTIKRWEQYAKDDAELVSEHDERAETAANVE